MNRTNLLLIPARGGSSRVKDKNIRLLNGKPLIVHTIEAALQSQVGRVVVSTDSETIAALAKSSGAEAPFIRPAELSGNTASSLGVIEHALHWFKDKEGWQPQLIAFCPPTNPLRTGRTIRGMIEELNSRPDINSIVTVTSPATHPFRIIRRKSDGRCENGVVRIDGKTINDIERSQDWPKVWEGSPACRITRSSYFLAGHTRSGGKTYDVDNFLGYEVAPWEAIDIDEEFDLKLTEFYMQNHPSTGEG
jgi:CMP-N-acetylneuraminic acid synthetase